MHGQTYYIGTSGWAYPEWKEVFYPEDLASKEWLSFYAKQFKTVEINGTFYHVPTAKTVQDWYKSTPKDFLFAIKLNRYITHMKRLHCDDEAMQVLRHFFDALHELREKLAVILVQLPAKFERDDERLQQFITAILAQLKERQLAARVAIEFRDSSWFCEEVFRLLRRHNIASVINSAPPFMDVDKTFTADFAYLRFHGEKALYKSEYSDESLQQWADLITGSSCRNVFGFFNNTMQAHALIDAKKLLGKLGVY